MLRQIVGGALSERTRTRQEKPNCAILDVKLDKSTPLPLAHELIAIGIPIILAGTATSASNAEPVRRKAEIANNPSMSLRGL